MSNKIIGEILSPDHVVISKDVFLIAAYLDKKNKEWARRRRMKRDRADLESKYSHSNVKLGQS